MGKPTDSQDSADRSRSWARSLNWAKPSKHHSASKSELPIAEPRVNPAGNNGVASTTNPHPEATEAVEYGGGNNGKPFESAPANEASAARPAAAPPPVNTQVEGEKSTAINGEQDEKTEPKPPLSKRAKAGSLRFYNHLKNAIFHSWINVLLIFVPIGIVVKAVNLNASVVFAMNAVAVVPLAGLLAHATESVASRLGDTLGALLNVSFGNAVELIIL